MVGRDDRCYKQVQRFLSVGGGRLAAQDLVLGLFTPRREKGGQISLSGRRVYIHISCHLDTVYEQREAKEIRKEGMNPASYCNIVVSCYRQYGRLKETGREVVGRNGPNYRFVQLLIL